MAGLGIDRVQALFAQEAEVRLGDLNRLLLELEHASSDDETDIVGSVFRELHTIKGSSALAGLPDVSRIAHELEEVVDDMRAARQPVTPELIDTLFAGVDRLATVIAGGHGASTPSPGTASETPDQTDDSDQTTQPVPKPAPPPPPAPRPDRHTATEPAHGVVMVPMERLDELVRLVGETASAHLRVGRMLGLRFGVDPASLAEFNRLSRSLNDLQDRAMRTRMVPVSTVTGQLHRAVRDTARALGKEVVWDVRGAETELDRGVLHRLADALLHLVRNAVDHGIESPTEREAAGKPRQGTIRLHAMQLGSEVTIAVTDDGRGIDMDRVRQQAARQGLDTEGMREEELLPLVFRSGLSTASFVTDVSGRGVGLDVVHTSVEAANGRVEVRSDQGVGTEFQVIVPITIAVLRCLLVRVGGQDFALPFHRVVCSRRYDTVDETHAEGRSVLWVDGLPVPVSDLAPILATTPDEPAGGPIVVLADTVRRHGFRVGRLVGQRDVVLKGLSPVVPHLPAVAGAGVEADGSILVVLDPPGLIQLARQARRADAPPNAGNGPGRRRNRILVVDDALTVRELQRSILERAGFDVRVATDGAQALSCLAESPSDLVLTDVEMPNMDGFALTEAIRAHQSLANIPVLILSSRASDEDIQRGLAAGADGYLLKSGFDQGNLVTAVNRLLGSPPGDRS